MHISRLMRCVVALLTVAVIACLPTQAQAMGIGQFISVQQIDRTGIVSLLHKIIKNFHYLEYYKSRECVVQIPGMGQDLTFNWGFGGSGDLLTPLSGINISIKDSPFASTPDFDNKKFLGQIAVDVFKQGFEKNKTDSEFLAWLLDGSSGPVKLFVIKILLLVKDQAQGMKAHEFGIEFSRLLFRLSLCNQGTGVLEKIIIPQPVVDLFNRYMPGLYSVISMAINGALNIPYIGLGSTSEQPVAVHAYVFADEQQANACLKACASCKNFDACVSSFIARCKNMQIIDYQDYTKLPDSIVGLAGLDLQLFSKAQCVGKFVSDDIFARQVVVPTEILNAVREQCIEGNHAPFMCQADGLCWVMQQTDVQDILVCGKDMMYESVALLREYAVVKAAWFNQHPVQAAAYKLGRERKEQISAQLRDFVITPRGIEYVEQITRRIADVAGSVAHATAYTDQQIQDQQVLIAALENQISDKRKELANWAKLMDMTALAQEFQQNVAKNHTDVAAAINQLEIQLTAERQQLACMLPVKKIDIDLSADKKIDFAQQIAQLNKELEALAQFSMQDGIVDVEVYQEMEHLQGQVAQLEQKMHEHDAPAVDACVAYCAEREAIANILEEESKRVFDSHSTIMAQEGYCLDRIARFKQSVYLKKMLVFAQALNDQAIALRAENADIITLNQYRGALNSMDVYEIDQDTLDQVLDYEQKVGVLLDVMPAFDLTQLWQPVRGELALFAADLMGNDPYFTHVRERAHALVIKTKGCSVLGQLGFVGWRYLIKTTVPDLMPLFDKLSAIDGM